MKNIVLVLIALALSSPLAAAAGYHLELEANPAAPFPFLGKFGKIDIHVYSGGVRADTIWLDGFSRNGAPAVTVMNPLGRMYTDVPLREISAIVAKLAGPATNELRGAAGRLGQPAHGTVRGIAATRHRISYGPEAWIDIWTTSVVPENPQLKQIVDQFVSGVSPATAPVARTIPGTPLYVELNFRRFRKVPLLRMKSLTFDDDGEAAALKLGAVYVKAPLLDSLWK